MIRFIPFQENHLQIFNLWLQKPHIKPVWQEPEDPTELKEKFLVTLPSRGVHAFIISLEDELIGYIQYYNASTVGGGWWENEQTGTYGIDLMIGDERKIGIGIGPKVIQSFISFLCTVETDVNSIIIDPEPTNLKAIRAFEKAGFVCESEITTPGGRALLMRMKISHS